MQLGFSRPRQEVLRHRSLLASCASLPRREMALYYQLDKKEVLTLGYMTMLLRVAILGSHRNKFNQ